MHHSDNDNDSCVELTQKLVRIPSVTAVNSADYQASVDCLGVLAEEARLRGAQIEWLSFSGDHDKWGYPVDNLYIEWVFGQGRHHLCYMGHLDVVPPGDIAQWSTDPFSGDIHDGYLYGRGVTDMKGSVAAFITGVFDMLDELATQDLRLGMIITMDEEWAAINGSKKVLQWMHSKGMRPDAFIVGEPSSQDILGSHIKTGRRGSLCGFLKAHGVQGHAAYTGAFENPNRALSLAASILNNYAFADGTSDFPASNFEVIATTSGDFAASAIIPGHADLLWNIRYTPSHSPESLLSLVKNLLDNPPAWARQHRDFVHLRNITVTANIDTASKPYYKSAGTLARAAQQAIFSTLGKNAVADGSGGTTDGRFAAEIFSDADIIELGLPERGGLDAHGQQPLDYLQRGGMHQVDERASLQDLINLKKIFRKTVLLYAQAISSNLAKTA